MPDHTCALGTHPHSSSHPSPGARHLPFPLGLSRPPLGFVSDCPNAVGFPQVSDSSLTTPCPAFSAPYQRDILLYTVPGSSVIIAPRDRVQIIPEMRQFPYSSVTLFCPGCILGAQRFLIRPSKLSYLYYRVPKAHQMSIEDHCWSHLNSLCHCFMDESFSF